MSSSRSILRPWGLSFPKPHCHYATKGYQRPTSISTKNPLPTTKLSVLYNGLRVITEAGAIDSRFSVLGVGISAGPRYENAYFLGASHTQPFIATLRFKHHLSDSMAVIGANVSVRVSREFVHYSVAVLNEHVDRATCLLAQTVREHQVSSGTVSAVIEAVTHDTLSRWRLPHLLLPELAHQTAYAATGLGNRLFCPVERIRHLTSGLMSEYRRVFYRSDRMVYVGVGIKHGQAVKLAERYFGDMPRGEVPVPAEVLPPPRRGIFSMVLRPVCDLLAVPLGSDLPPLSIPETSAPNTLATTYTGGTHRQPHMRGHPDYVCGATLILVAFQSFSLAHPDRPVMLILRQLLGGGSTFSPGGPGRGALSRLYRNCLLPHPHWVFTCNVFDMAYSDSGLFGATASSPHPGAGRYLFLLLLAEMQSLVKEITMDELRRAKAMAKSAFLMGVEEKIDASHELGMMVSAIGRKREMAREIDSVTLADLKRVVVTVFRGKVAGGSGRPTVVVLGKKAEANGLQDDFVADMMKDFNLGRVE